MSEAPEIILLDGAMGQELVNRSGQKPTGLWSTKVMADQPHLVAEIHADYFAAGAIVATTNTYAIHRDRLKALGVESAFRDLHEQALGLATRARDQHGRGYVAGSLGPLGWSYRPDLAPPAEDAADFYAEIAQIHAPFVDLFICETMCSIDQARGAVMGATVPNKPIWCAVSVDDEDGTRLRSGEPVADLAEALADLPVAAWLVNCSLPEAVTQAVPCLAPDGPRGAYANGFTAIDPKFARPQATVDDLAPRSDLGPADYADHALRWADDGATILGGCCEIGPAHIDRLRRDLDREGYRLAEEIAF